MNSNSGLVFPFKLPDPSSIDSSLQIPAIKQWRSFNTKDLPKISRLIVPSIFDLFGNIDVEEVLELSGRSVVMENVNNELIAAMCLRNYPNVPALLPDVWQNWMIQHYRLYDVNYENTIFIHLLVWDRRYNWEFLSLLLKSQFLNSFKLQHIVLIAPPKCNAIVYMADYLLHKCFTRILPAGQRIFDECQTLFIAFRHHVLPPMIIRRAVPEDNDDLVAIVDKTSPILRQTYGDFYIAEILLDKPSSRDIIVIENNSFAIGMLSFNSNVSLEKLLLNFEVLPFHGFRKDNSADNLALGRPYESSSKESKIYNEPAAQLKPFSSEDVWKGDSLNLTVDESDESKNTLKTKGSSDEYRAILQMLQEQFSSSESDFSDTGSTAPVRFGSSSESEKHRFYSRSMVTNLFETNLRPMESDAFIIELFALDSDYDERLAYIMLEASFECYPNINYCLIAIPSRTRYFPLLRHFVKVVVRSFRGSHVKHSLYAVHKNALLSCLSVRLATVSDEENIRLFIESTYKGGVFVSDMMEAIDRATNKDDNAARMYPFVVLTDNIVIGIIILESYNNLDCLRMHYDVDSYVTSKYRQTGVSAMIRCCIIHPVFLPRFSFIFSELFRQTGFTCCFYQLKFWTRKDLIANTVLCEMIPIPPRKRVNYMYQFITDELRQTDSPLFGLYHISVKSCEHRKVNVNKKIIVVGCSTVAIAFLENLLVSKETQHIWFTHITLIAPNGLGPIWNERLFNFFVSKYTSAVITRLCLPSWVNIVEGRVTQINRKEKIIMINDIEEVHYDRLYLFCGLQYDYPIRVMPLPRLPKNVVFINTTYDIDDCLEKTNNAMKTIAKYNIIVYGDSHRSYSCLDKLLSFGTDPSKITFIRPDIPNPALFNDPFVAEQTERILKRSKIKVLNSYTFTGWKLDNDTVSTITVQSENCVKQLQCSVFINFEILIVARDTIKVLNDAGLLFDGRLVIDENCHTNDPYIYAAGPMTKYKRILYADNFRHEHYDSMEIGQRLSKQLLAEVDPQQQFEASARNDLCEGTVYQYRKPMVEYCRFPGNRFYACIRSPGVPIAYKFAKSFDTYGVDIVTGDQDLTYDYFRIHLNQYNSVTTIVCFAKKPIDVQRYVKLWGKHESLLGNLRKRYELNEIKCLYEFFDRNWACALYHDRFELLDEANAEVLKLKNFSEYAMMEDITQKVQNNNYRKLSKEQLDEIMERYSKSAYEERIRYNTMKFIMDHSDELPMYYSQNS